MYRYVIFCCDSLLGGVQQRSCGDARLFRCFGNMPAKAVGCVDQWSLVTMDWPFVVGFLGNQTSPKMTKTKIFLCTKF